MNQFSNLNITGNGKKIVRLFNVLISVTCSRTCCDFKNPISSEKCGVKRSHDFFFHCI